MEVRDDPRRGDALTVTTWARRFDRVMALREFEVWDPAGHLVAAATSRWVVVDLAARRVVRLPEFIRRLPVADRPQALQGADGELPRPAAPAIEKRFRVHRSDLDAARHLNNTRYVEWSLEAVPDECWDRCRLRGFEIVFRRESLYGDTLRAAAAALTTGAAPAFAHLLERERDGEEVARAVSRWAAGDPPRALPAG